MSKPTHVDAVASANKRILEKNAFNYESTHGQLFTKQFPEPSKLQLKCHRKRIFAPLPKPIYNPKLKIYEQGHPKDGDKAEPLASRLIKKVEERERRLQSMRERSGGFRALYVIFQADSRQDETVGNHTRHLLSRQQRLVK